MSDKELITQIVRLLFKPKTEAERLELESLTKQLASRFPELAKRK